MVITLSSVGSQSEFVYLNNAVVALKSVEPHAVKLLQVLAKWRDTAVTVRLRKCSLLAKERNYLDQLI